METTMKQLSKSPIIIQSNITRGQHTHHHHTLPSLPAYRIFFHTVATSSYNHFSNFIEHWHIQLVLTLGYIEKKFKSLIWFLGHFWEKKHSWKIEKIAVRDHPFMMIANFTLFWPLSAILKTLLANFNEIKPLPLQIADVLNGWSLTLIEIVILKKPAKQMMKSAHFLVMLLTYNFWKQNDWAISNFFLLFLLYRGRTDNDKFYVFLILSYYTIRCPARCDDCDFW